MLRREVSRGADHAPRDFEAGRPSRTALAQTGVFQPCCPSSLPPLRLCESLPGSAWAPRVAMAGSRPSSFLSLDCRIFLTGKILGSANKIALAPQRWKVIYNTFDIGYASAARTIRNKNWRERLEGFGLHQDHSRLSIRVLNLARLYCAWQPLVCRSKFAFVFDRGSDFV
jgi:hypothetical protein